MQREFLKILFKLFVFINGGVFNFYLKHKYWINLAAKGPTCFSEWVAQAKTLEMPAKSVHAKLLLTRMRDGTHYQPIYFQNMMIQLHYFAPFVSLKDIMV